MSEQLAYPPCVYCEGEVCCTYREEDVIVFYCGECNQSAEVKYEELLYDPASN